jgi:subtilisin family serine protease
MHAGISRVSLFKAASKSSIKLSHFRDYLPGPEIYLRAFTEADGIYFEELKVAVVNFEKEDQIDYLNERLSGKGILFTEPERYVYKVVSKSRRRFAEGEDESWGIKAVHAHESPFSGKGVRIAILDTGVFKEHTDLTGRKIKTKKFVDSGSAMDADGHGTHCTGIACGHSDSNGFRYGVAFESEIYCGKVLNDQGEGTDGGILAGIEWAISQKCKVVSMSLGAPAGIDEAYSETYENVAMRAMRLGTLIVAAAGNESDRPDFTAPVSHPANCPSIMAVGAVDHNLKIAPFSSGGLNPDGGQIDIVAPGVSVYSMINTQNEHAKWNGTSMATPFVAGVAGLFFEQYKEAKPLEIWSLLTQHARRLNVSSMDAGSGLVQAP